MAFSISPFGEAKVGIPYALVNGVNIYIAFIFCVIANILVFPLMTFFLDKINTYFYKWRFYKRSSVYIARKAKTGAQKGIDKYGFWGLMLFVMVPIPGTGVYAGTIAAYIFKIERKKAFLANSIGIFISSVIIWVSTLLALEGLQ
ncbi:MAG: small multi-drug export protein [Flavobacteriales bacterium]|nr:small multi-drug export protein [Flavobacteriales bacterium]